MAQVNSENTTTMPVDPTRRHFLTVAAGGAVAAMAITTHQAAGSSADPIFAAIEAHRKARAASDAASAEVKRLCSLADEIAGPRKIDIPSMIEPGATVSASCWWDVEQAIPSEQFPEQHAHYVALIEERSAARYAVTGNTDPIGEEQYDAEWDAVGEFANTVPITLSGLRAMILYASEIRGDDSGAFSEHHCELLENLATAATALIGRES